MLSSDKNTITALHNHGDATCQCHHSEMPVSLWHVNSMRRATRQTDNSDLSNIVIVMMIDSITPTSLFIIIIIIISAVTLIQQREFTDIITVVSRLLVTCQSTHSCSNVNHTHNNTSAKVQSSSGINQWTVFTDATFLLLLLCCDDCRYRLTAGRRFLWRCSYKQTKHHCLVNSFYAWQHICYSAYMLSPFRLSVRLSCLSDGWIIQKRLNLGLWNFHYMVAPSL